VAVAFDAVGPSSTGTTSATSPLTWTHVCGASATDLVVGATYDKATDTGGTMSATYNGVSMTSLGVWHTGGGTAGFLQMWYMSFPPTGSHSVSITFTNAPSGVNAGSISFTGGGARSSVQNATSSGAQTNPTLTFTGSTSGNMVVACVGAGSTVTQAGSFTQRYNTTSGSGAAGAGFTAGATIASPGGSTTANWTMAADFWAVSAIEIQPGVPSGASPQPQRGSLNWRRRHRKIQTRMPLPFAAQNIPATATLSGVGSLGAPLSNYITDLASRTGISYFVDSRGNPRLIMGDAVWALMGNAGRWNSGNWQGDFDTFTATRAAQGFNILYGKPIGTTQSGNLDNFGKTFDGLYPFQGGTPSTGVSGANPSSGLTAAFWARIDYFLNSCVLNGITVMMNAIGYDSDFEGASGPLVGKPSSEWQAYGAALGARYANQPNLIWHLADDYFGGSSDTLISAFMTGVRGAGDTHLVGIENMPESDCRQTFDSTPATCAWGTSNAQYNFVYSYNQEYYAVEQSYAETSPITVFKGDGYFYQGNSTYSTFDRGFRQAGWWALAAGARGRIDGSESIWQWASTAQASSSTDWFYANNAKNMRTFVESLTHWWLLLPDNPSALITAGRGTRAGAIASGGGGGVYETAFTSSYVAASLTAAGDLALLYLPNHTTITVNQTLINSGGAYNAYWVDPVTTAVSATATGSTYNSTAQGTNSQGDPDWVLVLTTQTLSGSTIQGSATLTGTGTLTASPVLAGAATMSGVGTLTAGPQLAGAATMSGLGTLSVSAVTVGTTASLSGIGTLSVSGVTIGTTVTLSGSGTLTASSGGTAALSGIGTLTATVTVGTTVSFSGSGTLSAVAGAAATATLTGIGTLTAAPKLAGVATLTGAGTLTTTPVFTATATMSGLGTLVLPAVGVRNATSHPVVTAGRTSVSVVTAKRTSVTAVTKKATSSPAVSGG